MIAAAVPLPERPTLAGPGALPPLLAADRGQDLRLDATAVRRLDTLVLQALLVAAADRRARGARLVLADLSPALARQAAALGITPDHLEIEVSP